MAEEKGSVHQFRKHMDVIQPAGMAGEAAVDFGVRRVEEADDNYLAGIREAKKYSVPVMEVMAAIAARETAAGMKAEVRQAAVAAKQAERLIRDGGVSMADFGDKKLFTGKLEQAGGLSRPDLRRIVRFRQCAHDMLLIKDALETGGQSGGLLDEREKEHLASGDFFDLGDRRTNDLLKLYFKGSKNDVLRSVNPASLDEKQIRRLRKSGVKNGFSAQDEAALRLVERQIQARSARIRAGRMAGIRRMAGRLKNYAAGMDENAGAGIRNVLYAAQVAKAGYAVAVFGLKTGVVAVSFAGKYTGVSALLHTLDRVRREKAAQAAHAVKRGIQGSKPYRAAARKWGNARAVLEGQPAVRRFKELQKKAAEKQKAAARKVSRAKAAARAAGRRVSRGADFVFRPVRLAGRVVNFFQAGMGKIRLFCMAAAGACVVFFLLLVVLLNAILSVCQTQAETAFAYIMTEDEGFIGEVTALLQGEADRRLEEAREKISGRPEGSRVHGGRQPDRYGCPDGEGGWTAGGKIVYVDGEGNQLLFGANNIKDVIVLSYLFMDAGFDGNEAARDALLCDVWQMMNPELVWEESEIYTCQGGCEAYAYSCDSESDLSEIGRLEADGVVFFGSLEECRQEPGEDDAGEGAGDEGAEDKRAENAGEGQEADGESPGTGGKQAFSCSGHSVSVCYGHRDLTVYVSVRSMEEIFSIGEMPDAQGIAYQAFLKEFEGWTEENIEWAESLYQSDWFELYGVDPSAGSAALAGMDAGQISAVLAGYGELDAARAAVCEDAMSFVGRIPYYWGGKASVKSYEGNAFYFREQ